MSLSVFHGFGATLVAMALAACAGASGERNAMQPPPGVSSDFKYGYLAGCDSGYADGGWNAGDYVRNDESYATNAEYHRGWDRGEAVCYEDQMEHPRILTGR
jgi:hypothetical protein